MPDNVKRNLIPMKAALAQRGFGRTRAYELITEGKIVACKQGHRTMADADSIDAYHASLTRLVAHAGQRGKENAKRAPAADVPA